MSISPAAKKHAKYYFEDGNVVFLTNDNTLFRLHKSILKRHSTFFEEMFGLDHISIDGQAGKEVLMDGSSDEYPIQLGGDAVPAALRDAELEPICKVLYDMPGISMSKLDLDEVITLFYSTNKFQFDTIYRATVEYLDTAPIQPWKRYSLGSVSCNEAWLLRGCFDICSLADYPPPELFAEFSYLNAQDQLVALLRTREEYRISLALYTQSNSKCPTDLDWETTGVHSCKGCRRVLKDLLQRILTGNGTADLDGSNPVSLPLLKDCLIRGIQPRAHHSLDICSACRAKEDDIATQALGPTGLERRIGEFGQIVSL